MKVLPDTSIWVDYLRHGASGVAGELDELLAQESVVVCGPVLAELMAGTPPERQEGLWLAVGNLPWADIDQSGWRRIGEIAGALRRRGASVPLTDVSIAIACVGSEADLWTRDRDFERVREALPELRLR